MTKSNLPEAVSRARLPATYMDAKAALAKCERIDECKDWADKAEAMASYARQSGDTELRKMADRIQARAVDRCGQLIKQIPSEQGKRTDKQQSGGGLKLSARDIARIAAGVSKRLAKTAVAVNSVPRARFEREVESTNPPSVTKLAEMGRQHRQAPKPEMRKATPEEKRAAAALTEAVDDFLQKTKGIKIELALNGCTAPAAGKLADNAKEAQTWLAMLVMKTKGRKAWAEP
jgi:hypothetical protein